MSRVLRDNIYMNNKELIENLKQIKKSIMLGADGGVTDTAWLIDSPNETIVERIDYILINLGCDIKDLENENILLINIDYSHKYSRGK